MCHNESDVSPFLKRGSDHSRVEAVGGCGGEYGSILSIKAGCWDFLWVKNAHTWRKNTQMTLNNALGNWILLFLYTDDG